MKACPACELKYPSSARTCFVDGTALVNIADPRIGTTIAGRYAVESVIAEGGMATVYRAHFRLVDRPCAIKVMHPNFATSEVMRERFRREAKATQKLAHPNIVDIFDQGELPDGSFYLVMELLEGETLAELLDQGPVPLDRALPILIEIARALARAHDLGVVHRDLKPENIFLAQELHGSEAVKLLDFGIARSLQDARITESGEVFGTPQYMAPERITSIDAGPAADLYALGVIMYQMLTGELPFRSADVTGFFVQHLRDAPPPPRTKDPSIPDVLEELVLELLEKDPKDRPVDARRLEADLVAIAGQIGVRVPQKLSTLIESSRPSARTLPPVAIDRWVRRTALFDQMLTRIYPNGAPAELTNLLGRVKELVARIIALRDESVDAQRRLESVEQKLRESRQRFGHAVDALGVDASRLRDELKVELANVSQFERRVTEQADQFREACRDVVRWEGRSAFVEPYPDLAAAYRLAATRVDEWATARDEARAAQAKAEQKRGEVGDLEFQIKELQSALAQQEDQLEAQAQTCQEKVGEHGKRADDLENELVELATRFCAPLRQRSELRGLFKELEADAAA
jgi:eukaryotic-like serine/threonine-protein kinase